MTSASPDLQPIGRSFSSGHTIPNVISESDLSVRSEGSFVFGLAALIIYSAGRMSDVTCILNAIEQGDPKATEELLPLVYTELRRLAAHKMAHEPAGQTLQPTALVHEAWLRLVGAQNQNWQNRAHFFGAAAEAMRRILIDNARRKRALRHGGGQQRLDIQEMDLAAPTDDDQLLAIHEALDKLAAQDRQKAELVKLRYFVGLTNQEAAPILGISEPTAKRWWAYARAWLYQEIQGTS